MRGTEVRLGPTLQTYLQTLEAIDTTEETEAIKQFVQDLYYNIEVYGADSKAVAMIREKYHSATVINFCNLAIQSLNGVDNKDKLIAFKIELTQKDLMLMTERANKAVEKGSRAIVSIYFILFQFVVLSWAAKLGSNNAIVMKIIHLFV